MNANYDRILIISILNMIFVFVFLWLMISLSMQLEPIYRHNSTRFQIKIELFIYTNKYTYTSAKLSFSGTLRPKFSGGPIYVKCGEHCTWSWSGRWSPETAPLTSHGDDPALIPINGERKRPVLYEAPYKIGRFHSQQHI